MRPLAIVIAGCGILCSLPAAAGPSASELQAQGEELAKAGRFTDAIDAFKSADRIEIRASHACLIALAYTRREAWPQAELWLDACHTRATSGDPLPDWAAELDAQVVARLAAANLAAVELAIEPADAHAKLTSSSFTPDETFDPRTIHLPPGHHVFVVKAPGFDDAQQAIDVTDKTQKRVVIALHRSAVAQVDGPRGRGLLYAGVAVAGAGVLTYGWMSYEYLKLRSAHDDNNLTAFHDHDTTYKIAKYSTIGLWAIGGAMIITDLVLGHHGETAVAVAPLPGGAMAIVELPAW